jgi:hypothetical protein
MAGTIVSDTVQDGTGNSTPTTTVIKGSAKAWVSYNGVGQVVRNSFNVSSVTFNANGIYTVNFTNAIASADPATLVSAGGVDTGTYVTFPTLGSYNSSASYSTTTSVRVYVSSPGSGTPGFNAYYYCVAVFA